MIPPRAWDSRSHLAGRRRHPALGCGTQGVDVADDEPAAVKSGAVLFAERCSGCHTLQAAGTQGTANRSQRTQGPNLDQRTETYDDVIFAIRNGGFSGAIMPQNIVVGEEADEVAQFVAKYAGQDVAGLAPHPGAGRSRARPEADPARPRAGARGPGAARSRRRCSTSCSQLDQRRRELLPRIEEMRAERNAPRTRSRRRSARERTPRPGSPRCASSPAS